MNMQVSNLEGGDRRGRTSRTVRQAKSEVPKTTQARGCPNGRRNFARYKQVDRSTHNSTLGIVLVGHGPNSGQFSLQP